MKQTIKKNQITQYIIFSAVKEGVGKKNAYFSFSVAKVKKLDLQIELFLALGEI
jgi:hypothetical protein